MLAVYRAFRVLHGANEKNQPAMFKLNRLIAHPYSAAMMQVCQANAEQIAAGKPAEGMDPITHPDALALSTESLSRDYPLFATSLLNLVTNAESGCWPPMPPPTANNDPTLPSPATRRGVLLLHRFPQPAGHGGAAALLPQCAPAPYGRGPPVLAGSAATPRGLVSLGLPSVARLVVPEKNFALLACSFFPTTTVAPPIFPFLG